MFSYIWHTIFFDPVYNLLIGLIDLIPSGDVGIAIILLTVVTKIVLLPLSIKAQRTQRVMREIEPAFATLKEKYKDDREALGRETLAMYRDAGINPFAGIGLMLIQIPIIIALYVAIYSGGGVRLPDINSALLYSFVPSPESVSMLFFGLVDMASRNIPLAILAGLTLFLRTKLTLPPPAPKKEGSAPNLREDFARSMHIQMLYVMPIVYVGVGYSTHAAVSLYFVISNVLDIVQEWYTGNTNTKEEKGSTK